MKRILSLIIVTVLALSAFGAISLSASAGEEGYDIISPQIGQVFGVTDDVNIDIVASRIKDGKDNYCEVLIYRIKDGLKVMEHNLPYTETGQKISTTFKTTEPGNYVIYISYYYGSGFIHYQDDRGMYYFKGKIIDAHDARQYTIEGTPATEEPATEEPATEESATEESATEEPATEEPATEAPGTLRDGDYQYIILENGTAEIKKYIGKDTEITIPSTLDNYTVTSLGDFSFHQCASLKHIKIPETVTRIGFLAFADCTSLEDMTIPDSVTVLENKSFHNCSNLKTVTIGNSIKKLNNGLLAECTSLKSIILGSSVEEFDSWSIEACPSLTEFQVPATATTIRDHVFAQCPNLLSLSVADGNPVYDSRDNCNAIIETASSTLISGCRGTVIPDSVERIGEYAFYGCAGLTDIKIPDSVSSIGEEAFFGCTGIKTVTVPATVTSIDEKAFGYYSVDYVEYKISDFTICGYEGSKAEKYANDNGITFKAVTDQPDPPYLLGDADGNGDVDTADATVIQRAVTKIVVPYEEEQLMRGDVDGDGGLTIVDATLIQRFAVKVITPYPIGEPIS